MLRTITAFLVVLTCASVTPAFAAGDEAPARPTLLPVLYATYAGLQAFDVYSTHTAIARGAREANPLMQHVVGNQSAFWAMKISATAGTIIAAEHLWKNNQKGAAIALLVASNSVAAMVGAHNARVLRTR